MSRVKDVVTSASQRRTFQKHGTFRATVLVAGLWILLQTTWTGAQEPSAENFERFRTYALGRLQASDGKRMNPHAVAVFGLTEDIRILTDAEMVLPGRRLTLMFSASSFDVFLTDSHKTTSGTVVTVFHTDLSLALRAAASGESTSTLRLIANDGAAAFHFREVLLKWDRELPQMLALEERREKSRK